MLQSLGVLRATGEGFVVGFTMHYAKFFHGGTGVHGPTGQRIVPTTAKVLAFSVRGARGMQRGKRGRVSRRFAFRSVKGSPPRPLLPEGGSVPQRWSDEINATASEVVKQHFGRR